MLWNDNTIILEFWKLVSIRTSCFFAFNIQYNNKEWYSIYQDQFFFGIYMALLIAQLKMYQETWWETEGEWHAAKGPRSGVDPGATAAMTKPLYMGRLLYQLS